MRYRRCRRAAVRSPASPRRRRGALPGQVRAILTRLKILSRVAPSLPWSAFNIVSEDSSPPSASASSYPPRGRVAGRARRRAGTGLLRQNRQQGRLAASRKGTPSCDNRSGRTCGVMLASAECLRRIRGVAAIRRNVHVAAAASPRTVSAEYPRRGRGVAAIRLRGISTSRPRRRREPSPRNIHRGVTAACFDLHPGRADIFAPANRRIGWRSACQLFVAAAHRINT